MDALLQMRGITKGFPGVKALRGVDIDVFPGEIVALIGENGAGKSTLMKILGGVHQPDEGTITVGGKDVRLNNVNDSIGLGIGFIHQELNVLDNLDVAANVFLGREPRRALGIIDSKRLNDETKVHLERLDLHFSPRTPLSQLSLAQRQMVEIAKALSLNARLIIMDEPTSSLTLSETQRLLEVARDLRAQGVSIIYISHRLGEIEAMCDRVVALRDGANAGGLSREEISHDRMVRLMVGRELEHLVHNMPHADSVGESTLVVKNLRTRRYPTQSVSFEVRRGEILGFAGLVGAGRSEVAQAVFGVEPKLAGEISLNGQALSISNAGEAIAHGICLVPEDRRHTGLIPEMTLRENISLPSLRRHARLGLVARENEATTAQEMCKRLNVKTPSVEAEARNLSGGNQQKVVLAKWMAMNPKVIIFDEPTRGIDVGAKAEIYKLMRALADDGVGVIMISSDMEEVLGQSDRIAVMHEGAITGVLSREEASEEAIMQRAVGRSHTPENVEAAA